MSKVSRIYFYDNLKFILILFVVIGHLVDHAPEFLYRDSFFSFIYTFHMPLFVLITGFFAKRLEDKNGRFRLDKVINYLLLYLIFKITLYIFLKYLIGQDIEFALFSTRDIPWYLLSCSLWFGITYLVRNVKPRYMIAFSVIMALAVGYDFSISDGLSLSRTFVFYPFFLLGFYTSKDNMNKLVDLLHQKKWRIISALGLISLLVFYILLTNHLQTIRLFITGANYYYFPIPFNKGWLYPVFRFALMCVSLITSLMVMALVPKNKTRFTKLGERTLQIYFIHNFLIYLFYNFDISNYIVAIFGNYYMFFCVLAGILIALFCSLKWFQKPFDKILALKYEKIFNK